MGRKLRTALGTAVGVVGSPRNSARISTAIYTSPTKGEVLPLLAAGDNDKAYKATFGSFMRHFWPTGLVSFGGSQAHVALMQMTFVDGEWQRGEPHVPEGVFLELYALCQSLPGPGSTQLATALGATFGGLLGALLTFLVFFVPGFVVMSLAGLWYRGHLDAGSTSFIVALNAYLSGLVAAAFAMVALSAYRIVTECDGQDRIKWTVTLVSTLVALSVPVRLASASYMLLLLGGGCVGLVQKAMSHRAGTEPISAVEEDGGYPAWECGIPPWVGMILVAAFTLLTALAIFTNPSGRANYALKVFWTIGAIGFGGGIVVIPMLLNEIVEMGLLPSSVFLAGFALFGCVPGPMSNLAAFLGAAIAGWPGACRSALGLFGPGIIVLLGVLPFWEQLRKKEVVRDFVKGVNSAASGLILAGVWMLLKRIMVGPASFALAISAGVSMTIFKIQSPIAILIHGALGALLVLLSIGGPFVEVAKST